VNRIARRWPGKDVRQRLRGTHDLQSLDGLINGIAVI
jgi:hypothetical protein